MGVARFAALCGPQKIGGRDRAFESVILECRAVCSGRLMVVNLDGSCQWPSRPAKQSRDGVFRFVREISFGDIPFVDSNDAQQVLSDILKRDSGKSLDDWTVLFLTHDPRLGGLYRVLDALGLFVPGDSRTLPWLFPLLRDIFADDSGCPVSMTVIDEPKIEKAAGFFVSSKKELESMVGKELSLKFNACIAFDSQKAAACASMGLSYIEMFPGQETHGQAKAIARGILSQPTGETGRGIVQTLKFLVGDSAE